MTRYLRAVDGLRDYGFVVVVSSLDFESSGPGFKSRQNLSGLPIALIVCISMDNFLRCIRLYN